MMINTFLRYFQYKGQLNRLKARHSEFLQAIDPQIFEDVFSFTSGALSQQMSFYYDYLHLIHQDSLNMTNMIIEDKVKRPALASAVSVKCRDFFNKSSPVYAHFDFINKFVMDILMDVEQKNPHQAWEKIKSQSEKDFYNFSNNQLTIIYPLYLNVYIHLLKIDSATQEDREIMSQMSAFVHNKKLNDITINFLNLYKLNLEWQEDISKFEYDLNSYEAQIREKSSSKKKGFNPFFALDISDEVEKINQIMIDRVLFNSSIFKEAYAIHKINQNPAKLKL